MNINSESTRATLEIPEGRHGCPLCPDRFDTVGDKRRHLRSSHPKTR